MGAGLLVGLAASIIAMIVYALVAWALVRTMWILFEDNPRRRLP